MARDEAYQEAERRIEATRQEGATELDLSDMGLTELPEAIASLTQLQTLDLSHNKLTELSEEIASLTQLQKLDLFYNQLTELPEAITSLTQLQSLDFSQNQLTLLPKSVCSLSNLSTLRLGENYISSLPSDIRHLVNLKKLDFDSKEGITRFPRFTKEDESNKGKLTRLPSEIGVLYKLEKLFLPAQNLQELPFELDQLTNLNSLDLFDNLLADLPAFLGHLPQLGHIDLNGNPLNPELQAAYAQGFNAVKAYLRAKAEDKVVLNEAKLILVGEGEVGKSCLLGALRGDEWVEGRPTTHGIEIKSVIVTASDSETEITLNAWDFGGQRVYRPTHQLFFSPSAVYLVVWKPREGPQQGFVKEWITLIKHREPDAKVLVVATHGGPGQRQPDSDRQELIDLFGNDTIVDFFHVDSKLGTGITELRAAIAKIAATLPGMGRPVPTKWQRIRELLEESGKTHLPYKDMIALCEEQGLEGFAAELFVRVSHTLGYLIHYHYDPILQDIVILKPDWLAKAISFVMDDKNIRRRNGLVEFDYIS